MIEVYEKKGIPTEDAKQIVELLSKYTDTFVDVMMVEELGIMPPDPSESPAKDGT